MPRVNKRRKDFAEKRAAKVKRTVTKMVAAIPPGVQVTNLAELLALGGKDDPDSPLRQGMNVYFKGTSRGPGTSYRNSKVLLLAIRNNSHGLKVALETALLDRFDCKCFLGAATASKQVAAQEATSTCRQRLLSPTPSTTPRPPSLVCQRQQTVKQEAVKAEPAEAAE